MEVRFAFPKRRCQIPEYGNLYNEEDCHRIYGTRYDPKGLSASGYTPVSYTPLADLLIANKYAIYVNRDRVLFSYVLSLVYGGTGGTRVEHIACHVLPAVVME
jgi:hypothetical protein